MPRGGYAQRRGRGMGVYSAKRPMAGPPGMTMGTVAEKNPYSAPKKVRQHILIVVEKKRHLI